MSIYLLLLAFYQMLTPGVLETPDVKGIQFFSHVFPFKIIIIGTDTNIATYVFCNTFTIY